MEVRCEIFSKEGAALTQRIQSIVEAATSLYIKQDYFKTDLERVTKILLKKGKVFCVNVLKIISFDKNYCAKTIPCVILHK